MSHWQELECKLDKWANTHVVMGFRDSKILNYVPLKHLELSALILVLMF